jgi:hypothetical protein
MGKKGNKKRKGETALRIWEALRSPTPESESSSSENSTVSERLARFDERAQYQKCLRGWLSVSFLFDSREKERRCG